MKTGKRRLPAFFYALVPLLCLAAVLSSCTQGKPVFRSALIQLVQVETESGVFSERLSYFALFEDSDGAYDFGSIRIVHDETGLEWIIDPAAARVRLRGADRWTGSAGLAGPGDSPVPGGTYSVTLSDLAGHESASTFTLVRPEFPERSPAVFSVRGGEWELVRNPEAAGFMRTFLFLSDEKGRLLYSYRVADSGVMRVTGPVASLLALAKDASTVQCYTENEAGTAGVLLIPVNIR